MCPRHFTHMQIIYPLVPAIEHSYEDWPMYRSFTHFKVTASYFKLPEGMHICINHLPSPFRRPCWWFEASNRVVEMTQRRRSMRGRFEVKKTNQNGNMATMATRWSPQIAKLFYKTTQGLWWIYLDINELNVKPGDITGIQHQYDMCFFQDYMIQQG